MSDDGTIAWFQDNTGGGLGYAIVRLDSSSTTPSVLEYSSRKLCQTIYDQNGNPIYIGIDGQPICDPQERDAGKNFGIASDGRVVSYFTFYDYQQGGAIDKPFDINAQAIKDPSGQKYEFFGYDAPDINSSSALVYSDDFTGPGTIYLATTAQPTMYAPIDGAGNPQSDGAPLLLSTNGHPPAPKAQYPHIGDGAKPEIAYLKNSVSVNHWPGADPANWVDAGLWADLAGSGNGARLAYEKQLNNHSQIWIAKPIRKIISTVSQTPQSALIGSQTSLVVQVTDFNQNPIAGTQITFSAADGTVSPSMSTTGPDGKATVQFTVGNHTGPYTITAECTNKDCAPGPVLFTIIGAVNLTLVSNTQTASICTTILSPITASVTDPNGNPWPNGIQLSFSLVTPNGSTGSLLSSTGGTTSSAGTLSSQLTVGTMTGPYQITASCPNADCIPNSAVLTITAQELLTLDLLDPVPDLLTNAQITADHSVLATQGRPIQGIASDGTAQAIIRISGACSTQSETLTLTVYNDQGSMSASAADDGALSDLVGSAGQPLAQLPVDNTGAAAGMAFAAYAPPINFVRSTPFLCDNTGAQSNLPPCDNTVSSRTVTVKVTSMTNRSVQSTPLNITIVRPPVMLVHGIWSNPSDTWGDFNAPNPQLQLTSLATDGRFSVSMIEYDTPGLITESVPSYNPTRLRGARTNSLGLAFNAPSILGQFQVALEVFRNGGNPAGQPVAAVQADVVAHSLGGDITRAVALQPRYMSAATFNQGVIHKLITIDTPHLGTPVAIDILDTSNDCVRTVLSLKGNFAFQTATTAGGNFNGAAFDLEGDGTGGQLSDALTKLQNPAARPIPTALLAGVTNFNNLSGLDQTSAAKVALHDVCGVILRDPLGLALTSSGWRSVFNDDNDGLVPLRSQIDGIPGITPQPGGYVHSIGTEGLGFDGPSVLDSTTLFPSLVRRLLETPINDPAFTPIRP